MVCATHLMTMWLESVTTPAPPEVPLFENEQSSTSTYKHMKEHASVAQRQ
jgi:hypothetical protein